MIHFFSFSKCQSQLVNGFYEKICFFKLLKSQIFAKLIVRKIETFKV